MTISSTSNKHVYSGNGATRLWSYAWPIIDQSDIEVWITDSLNVRTKIVSNYTIDTGLQKVTYPTIASALPLLTNTEKITLRRKIPLTQDVDLDNQGPLPSTTLEEAYDKLTFITQQHAEELARCAKFPIDQNPSIAQTESYLDDVISNSAAALASATNSANSAIASAASASASNISALAAAQSAIDAEAAHQDAHVAIQDFVDHFFDKHEVPAGIVNGVNVAFTLSLLPVNAEVKVFIDGLLVPLDKFSFVNPTITFVDAPAIGQKVEAVYITNGLTSSPVVPNASFIPEYRTITGGELAAKQLTLLHTPLVAAQVVCDMIAGSSQAYGNDFIVAGDIFNWNGLVLDGQILVGTILRISYYY